MCPDDLPFHTTTENLGEAVVLHVAGEVDSVTADELSACLSEAVRAAHPPRPVVVDLTGVTFLGACGIGLLLEHQDRCLRRGSALMVVAGTPAVLRPLRALELTGVLGVRPTVVEALSPAVV